MAYFYQGNADRQIKIAATITVTAGAQYLSFSANFI